MQAPSETSPASHFTTRRGFIAASGFGGLSLYGLWAAYGVAPTPLALLGLDGAHSAGHGEQAPPAAASAHSGHGGATTGPSAEEFNRLTTEFVERFRLPDGSVYPRRMAHAVAADPEDPHAGHHMPAAQPEAHAIDVLMVAGKWYYLPNVLRLDAGQPYRFKMMALDVAHGASIQFGKGGRMMHLLPGRVTQTDMTFSRPGRYLMHCTVYCGDAHDMMQATIEVV